MRQAERVNSKLNIGIRWITVTGIKDSVASEWNVLNLIREIIANTTF